MATAAVKRFEDEGSLKDDELYLTWFCAHAYQQIEQALLTITHNYPVRFLGKMLRLKLFFLGRSAHGPSDSQNLELAKRMMGARDGRDRLAGGIAIPRNTHEAMGALEEAYYKVLEVAPLDERVRAARKAGKLNDVAREDFHRVSAERGIITEEELKELQHAQELADAVVEVDDYTHAAYKKLKG